ncbi:3-oxoacyl-[acyl-carrier-protein] reductase FabG [Halioglobus japonicus]|nr:3-oxoacyl-[acyl-carrier-protein] reductase FabG [Halioglobus japonicus]
MSTSIDLTGQVALVTGGSKGIGRAIAEAFLDAGADVLVFDIALPDEDQSLHLHAEQQQRTITYSQTNTSDGNAVRDALAAYCKTSNTQGIDILVNNTGISTVKPFLDLAEEEWDSLFATNVKSVFHCCQAVLPLMLEKGRGCIVNIASELAYLGRAQFAAYTASKGAVLSLTRSLAREFAPTIKVNGIAPGPCDTDMLRGEIETPEQWEKEIDLPLGRVAKPEEIAMTAVFLASDFSSFYCGEILSPNGGSLMR